MFAISVGCLGPCERSSRLLRVWAEQYTSRSLRGQHGVAHPICSLQSWRHGIFFIQVPSSQCGFRSERREDAIRRMASSMVRSKVCLLSSIVSPQFAQTKDRPDPTSNGVRSWECPHLGQETRTSSVAVFGFDGIHTRLKSNLSVFL